jgi:hypothetical protein
MLNPFTSEVKSIPKGVWINLYRNFVVASNDIIFNNIFAEFVYKLLFRIMKKL